MNDIAYQIEQIEKMRRRMPSFMAPCVVEQGVIIYPKRRRRAAQSDEAGGKR